MSALIKVFVFILLLSGIGFLFMSRGDKEEMSQLAALPTTVLGEWQTMAPLFVDRALILNSVSFTMDLGEHGRREHRIQELRSRSDADSVWYAVRYFAEGEEQELHFRYLPAYDEIRLRNRDTVWWKRRDVIEKARADEVAEKKRRAQTEETRKRRRG